MMLKSELNSTDIYSNESDQDNEIILKIESTDPKWANLFLNAEGSDFFILHRGSSYPVHKHVFFKNVNLHVLEECDDHSLTLPDAFNPEMVQGVISCLYSLELKICRSQVLELLDVVHCLHISKLKRLLQEDIKNSIEDYQIFVLLEKSIHMGLDDIEELCLNQLEFESYQQMRYEKYELLNCNQDTFKLVIYLHNERRWEDPNFGLDEKFIQELIQEYCKHNNYNQKEKNQMLKDIIDSGVQPQMNFSKCKLTPLKINECPEESLRIRLYTPRSLNKDNLNSNTRNLSPYDENCCSTKSMIVDLTYMGQRKRKGSRGSDGPGSQNKMTSDYILLKELNKEMEDETEKLRDSLEKMTKSFKQKDGEYRNNKFALGEIEVILEECEKDLMEQNKSLMLLDVRLDKAIIWRMSGNEADYEQDAQSSDSSDEDTEDVPKSPNAQDEKLRVSLIQSKWVAC